MSVLTKFEILAIASVAHCDPRTVKSYLTGAKRPYPAMREALDAALRALGHDLPDAGGQP